MIPQVAKTPSVTVTAMCTVTVSFSGTPSYGIPSTDRHENEDITYVIASFQAIQTGNCREKREGWDFEATDFSVTLVTERDGEKENG